MAKTEFIQIRLSKAVKSAIEAAAQKKGQPLTRYLLSLAAQDDPAVKEALLND
jgi:uncharacterized protein (DUF1778 family)